LERGEGGRRKRGGGGGEGLGAERTHGAGRRWVGVLVSLVLGGGGHGRVCLDHADGNGHDC